MKVLVCCKAVPVTVTRVKVATNGERINYEGQRLCLNESDDYAVEEAMALKRELGAEVTVVTMGRLMSQDILYAALAKGADQAIRINAEFQQAEEVSTVLAAAARKTGFDLILTGMEAKDTMASQVSIFLAEKLGLPFAIAVTGVEPRQEGLRVTKELGSGRTSVVDMPLPALLAVQTGIQPLTYAVPARVIMARRKSLRSLSLSDLDLEEKQLQPSGRYRILDVFVPDSSSAVQSWKLPPS
jgi:electron transfer flavoprotein beta subunit